MDVHNKAILIDTHNDFLTKTMQYGYELDADLTGKTHSDLARFKKGGLDVQFSPSGAMVNKLIHMRMPIDK